MLLADYAKYSYPITITRLNSWNETNPVAGLVTDLGTILSNIMSSIYSGFCEYIFEWVVVRPNGKITACCPMRDGLGNLMGQSLEDIWNSESYRRFRGQGRDNGLPK